MRFCVHVIWICEILVQYTYSRLIHQKSQNKSSLDLYLSLCLSVTLAAVILFTLHRRPDSMKMCTYLIAIPIIHTVHRRYIGFLPF